MKILGKIKKISEVTLEKIKSTSVRQRILIGASAILLIGLIVIGVAVQVKSKTASQVNSISKSRSSKMALLSKHMKADEAEKDQEEKKAKVAQEKKAQAAKQAQEAQAAQQAQEAQAAQQAQEAQAAQQAQEAQAAQQAQEAQAAQQAQEAQTAQQAQEAQAAQQAQEAQAAQQAQEAQAAQAAQQASQNSNLLTPTNPDRPLSGHSYGYEAPNGYDMTPGGW